MTQLNIRSNYDRHIRYTRQHAFNQCYEAYKKKDYASTTEWSLLWFNCLIDSPTFTPDSPTVTHRLPNCS